MSEHTLEHANRIRQSMKTGDSHVDRASGPGPTAAALLLNLPPERLKRMFVTRNQVNQLTEEAFVVLGHMSHMVTVFRKKKQTEHFARDVASPTDAPVRLYNMANEFMDTAGGALIANRFKSALQILMHNAERLEAFAEIDDASDEQLDTDAASIFDLVQEHVSAHFENAPRIEFQARSDKERPLIAFEEEPLNVDRSGEVAPVVVHASRPEAQPDAVFESKAEGKASPDLPAATRQSTASRIARVAPRFRGSKPRNPAEHFHPRDHRALSRDQLKKREEVLLARELNFIGMYDKWTPELRSLLKERNRARRAAEQGTPNISRGQNMVQPPTLGR